MFQMTVPEPVEADVTVKLDDVRKGDFFRSPKGAWATVSEVKRGSKYVTVLDTNRPEPKVLDRDYPHALVLVRRETKESKTARYRADRVNYINEALRKETTDHAKNGKQLKVLEKLTAAAEKGYSPSSFDMTDLVEAQADDTVRASFFGTLAHQLEQDPEVNLVPVVEEYKAELMKSVVMHTASLSRSTSVMSNVLDDALNAARAKLVESMKWYWLGE